MKYIKSMILLSTLLLVTGAATIHGDDEGIDESTDPELFHYVTHFATETEVEKWKNIIGVYDPNYNYNILYNNLGTGLAPPTETEWNDMIGTAIIVDKIVNPPPLLASHDLSTDPWFPEVRSQGSQGSCAAWAATYSSFISSCAAI